MTVTYAVPVVVGGTVDGETVEEIGTTFFNVVDPAALVPVRFRSGRYAIIDCNRVATRIMTFGNEEVGRLIEQSSMMPVIRRGLASDVWHIVVHEGKKQVLIKVFYNFKSDRLEEVHR